MLRSLLLCKPEAGSHCRLQVLVQSTEPFKNLKCDCFGGKLKCRFYIIQKLPPSCRNTPSSRLQLEARDSREHQCAQKTTHMSIVHLHLQNTSPEKHHNAFSHCTKRANNINTINYTTLKKKCNILKSATLGKQCVFEYLVA